MLGIKSPGLSQKGEKASRWHVPALPVCKGRLYLPKVPRPPNRIMPNRANGRLMVTMFGVTFRMTISSEGLVGKS